MQDTKFSPHSQPLNSFRTTLSHQSLLHTCIQSICLVYCGINGASLFVYSCEKKGSKKTFPSQSRKRDAVRVHNWSNMTEVFAEEQVQRREIRPCGLLCITVIWVCIQLRVNWNNSAIFICTSRRGGLIRILPFLGKN